MLADEYESLEMENGSGCSTNKIVYDCLDENPPSYEKSKDYLDESEAIELPTDESMMQEIRGKNNWPFSHNGVNNFIGPTNSAGKKINRYY